MKFQLFTYTHFWHRSCSMSDITITGGGLKMRTKYLKKLRDEFREWCGLLSIEEIMANGPLIAKIERIEHLFKAVDLWESKPSSLKTG
jgi:hypothetical protein